jgi:chain length determinant protein EpsF
MNAQRILLALRARHWLVWGAVLLFGGLAIGYSLLATSRYTAQTQLLLDVREPEVLLNQGGSYSVLAPTYIATQVDILHSARVSGKVVRALGLDKNAQAIEQWKEGREGEETLEEYYGELLGKSLLVIPSRTSNTLTLEFTNPSAKFAAAVANAYAKAYLEATVEIKADPARSFAEWFGERVQQERTKLEAAQAKLSQFQRENGIVATDERLDMENARLAEINTQLTNVQAQLGESASREHYAQGEMGSSPDVMHNSVVETLRSDIARNEAKLQDLSKQYGSNHPAYQRAAAELDSLKLALDKEMRKVAGTVGTSNDVNVQREAQLRAALAAQKERVLTLRAQRDQVAVLQHDVESAQKAYELVNQRLSQTNLESQVQHTDIVVLSEAQPPIRPSSPKPLRNTAIGAALGLLVGLCLAIGLEMRRPLLRSESDIRELIGLPLLASLPGRRRRLRATNVGAVPA